MANSDWSRPVKQPSATIHIIETTPEQMRKVIEHAREVVRKSVKWRDTGPKGANHE